MSNLTYDTAKLVAVVPNLKRSQKFLLDRFFPNMVLSDTQKVVIDVEKGKRRLAPFVSPMVEGKVVEGLGYQTKEIEPAYIKDFRPVDLRRPVRRAVGEMIGGEMTGAEREAANLESEMRDQIDMIDRRLEWMSAQVLMNGSLTIEGEGYEPVLVDFGRDPALTLALAGNDIWNSGSGVSPLGMLEDFQSLVVQKSGATPTDVVFTNKAWKAFNLDPKLEKYSLYPQGTQPNSIELGANVTQGAVYKGKWGTLDLWLYNDWFVDANNIEQPMIDDGRIIMTSQNLMGTRAFGMIMDSNFQYKAMPYAPKTWTTPNPGKRYLMMQSSPIVIPGRPDASLSALVC